MRRLLQTAYNEYPTILRALLTIAAAIGFITEADIDPIVEAVAALGGSAGYLISWAHVRRQIDGPATIRARESHRYTAS